MKVATLKSTLEPKLYLIFRIVQLHTTLASVDIHSVHRQLCKILINELLLLVVQKVYSFRFTSEQFHVWWHLVYAEVSLENGLQLQFSVSRQVPFVEFSLDVSLDVVVCCCLVCVDVIYNETSELLPGPLWQLFTRLTQGPEDGKENVVRKSALKVTQT